MKPVIKRVVWLVVGGSVAYFAIQGGEYGTTDLLKQLRDRRRLASDLDSMQHVVDSLRAYRRALETDPKLQERIAREQFRMVKDGEILYIFDGPDTTK